MAGEYDLDALKSRLRLSTYVQRKVKLSPGKGDRFGLCPFHSEKSPSFTVNDAKGFFHCFGCGAHGDLLDWWQKVDGLTFAEARDRLLREAGATSMSPAPSPPRRQDGEDVARKQAEARAIWQASRPVGGTLAETYLTEVRRIGVALPPCLRFHPELAHRRDAPATFPALIAAVTDDAGELVAIQRTFLKPDGLGKAPIDSPKRGLGPVGRGAVRLAPAGEVLGVAEGIETGLSAMELFRVPVWCALGSNLARITLPPSIRYVVVFADRGNAGEAAAEKARDAFHAQRRLVSVRFPSRGDDFNDELRRLRGGD